MIGTEYERPAAQELELRLYRYLGIPVIQPDPQRQQVDRRFDFAAVNTIRELRRELFELRREASQIGRIPLEYPAHIVVVMKFISALIPWYTRPLVNFARRASRISDITAQLLDEVVKSHESLLRQVEEIASRDAPRRGITDEDSYSD